MVSKGVALDYEFFRRVEMVQHWVMHREYISNALRHDPLAPKHHVKDGKRQFCPKCREAEEHLNKEAREATFEWAPCECMECVAWANRVERERLAREAAEEKENREREQFAMMRKMFHEDESGAYPSNGRTSHYCCAACTAPPPCT